MLGKVLKMDMRELKSIYFPLYGIYLAVVAAFLIFTVVGGSNEAADNLQFEMIYAIITIAFGISLVALLLLSGVIIVYHFYRKTATEEAYLTMTLPVKPWEHVVSKMIANGIWQIITWCVFIGTVFLLLLFTGGIEELLDNSFVWDEVSMVLHSVMDELGVEGAATVVLGLVISLISFFTGPLVYFACIAIGQTARKHKILMSVGVYLLFNMLTSYFSGNILLILSGDSVNLMLLAHLARMLVFSVVFYLITVHFLSKKLNLE